MEIIAIFTFVFFSIIFGLCAYIASAVCRYYSKSVAKNSTYECGMTPIKDARINFEPKFLVYAIIFLLFDAEVILLLPYALCANELALFGLIEVIIFVLILAFALLFAVKSGILRFI